MSIQIKLEPEDSIPDSSSIISRCTCHDSTNEEFSSFDLLSSHKTKKSRQVLVTFGLNRKKVISLNRKKDNLHDLFCAYMLQEPAYSKLLEDSYVVFQEFNSKFETWVDVDRCENLNDGAVVKAVFFPKAIEREASDPSAVVLKRKKKGRIKVKKEKVKMKTVVEEKQVVEIDLSMGSDTERNAAIQDWDSETPRKKKKHKKSKSKKEDLAEASEQTKLERTDNGIGFNSTPDKESNTCENISLQEQQNSFNYISTNISSTFVPSNNEQKEQVNERNVLLPNRQACEEIPSLFAVSALDQALSLNKKLVAERYNTSVSNSYKEMNHTHQKIYKLNDAVDVLKMLCEEEGAPPPVYTQKFHKNDSENRVTVKGYNFKGRNKSSIRGKNLVAQKAIRNLYPHIKWQPERTRQHSSYYQQDRSNYYRSRYRFS